MITWFQKHKKPLLVVMWGTTIAFVGSGFVGWGAYSFKSNVIEKVGNETITVKEYDERYKILQKQNVGNGIKDTELKQYTLESLKLEKSYINFLKTYNFRATPAELLNEVSNISLFQNENKSFDKQKYQNFLTSNRLSPKLFEEKLLDGVYVKYISNMFDNLAVSETEIQTLKNLFTKNIELSYALEYIELDNPTITDTKISEYYESNKERFKKDPIYKLSYEVVENKNTVYDDTVIKDYYEKNKFSFPTITSFDINVVRPIFIEEEEKKNAQKEYLLLKKGKGQEIIKTIEVSNNGSFLPVDVINKLEKNGFNKPIKQDNKYYIVKIDDIKTEIKTLDEVKNTIKQELSFEKNKQEKLTAYSKTFPNIELTKKVKNVNKSYFFMQWGLDDDKINTLKMEVFNKSVGEGSIFYSPSMKALVVYKITNISKDVLTQQDQETIKGMLSKMKNTLYANYFSNALLKEGK